MNKLAQYLNQHLIGEVITSDAVLAKYSVDGSPLALKPEMVVCPRTTSDVRKLLRFAWQLAEKGHRLSVTARGAGTDPTGGAIGGGIVVATASHLSSIYEYDPKQRLVRLQPGARAGAVQNFLRLQGTWLPALQGTSDDVTVGGVVAAGKTNVAAGDWVDQLEVVLANGDVLHTKRLTKRELSKKQGEQGFEADIYRGLDTLIEDNKQVIEEKLHENSSVGYSALADVKQKDGSFDLTPLFVGAQGTLGVVTELILRSEFTASSTAVVAAAFQTAADARDSLDEVVKAEPRRVEYIDGALIKQAMKTGKTFSFIGDDGVVPAAVVVVTLHDATVRAQAKKMKKIAKVFSKFTAQVEQAEDMTESPLANLESLLPLAMHADGDGAYTPLVDGAYVPLSRFEEFSSSVAALAAKRRVALPLYGLPLEGVWYVRPLLNLKTTGGKQNVLKLVDEFGQIVERCEGSLASQSGEGRLQGYSAHKSLNDDVKALFAAVKKLFDPQDILNTGVKQSGDIKQLARQLRASYDSPHQDGLPRF